MRKHFLSIALLTASSLVFAQDIDMAPPAMAAGKMNAETEMMKIYVKEDPSIYKKQKDGNVHIDFSVQVAASSGFISEKTARAEWEGLGPVYVQKENGMHKIRIGPFETQQQAKEVLLEVKSKGRKDAFIVVRQQNTPFDQPMDKSNREASGSNMIQDTPSSDVANSEIQGEYKVRIASYLQPGGFNPDGVDNLGTLESYRKGEWTIMMIGGFRTFKEAEEARKVVVSKGFTDAAVIIDRDGILEVVKE